MITSPEDIKKDWAFRLDGGNTIYLDPGLLSPDWPLKDGAGEWTVNWPLLSTMVHEDIHIRLDRFEQGLSDSDKNDFVAWQHTWIGQFNDMEGTFIGRLYEGLMNYKP